MPRCGRGAHLRADQINKQYKTYAGLRLTVSNDRETPARASHPAARLPRRSGGDALGACRADTRSRYNA